MKKTILYNNDGRIIAIADGSIEYDKNIFTAKKNEITDEHDEKIKKGFRLKYTDKLEFEETEEIKKINLKEELTKAKTILDIKNILNKLL